MKARFYTLAIILLACIQVLSFVYITQAVNTTNGISKKLNDNPLKIVYVQAKDGYTPVKGLDYFDGAKGINAVSFSVTNNTLKEVPLIGENGKDGLNGKDGVDGQKGAYQEMRVNENTKDIESKYSDAKFWDVFVPCSDYRIVCP